MNDLDREEQIEDYVAGRMSTAERAAFAIAIAEDPLLAKEVREEELTSKVIWEDIGEDLKVDLAAWGLGEADTPQTPLADDASVAETLPPAEEATSTTGRSWLKWVILIGSLIAALLAYNYYRTSSATDLNPQESIPPPILEEDDAPIAEDEVPLTPTRQTPELTPPQPPEAPPAADRLALAMENYSLPKNLTTDLRSGDPSSLPASFEVFTEGTEAFAAGRYEEAIRLFESIDPQADARAFAASREYLAHAYFNVARFDRSADLFRQQTGSQSGSARDRAEWYLALSLLPNYPATRTELAPLLDRMSSLGEAHNYGDRAAALRERLK